MVTEKIKELSAAKAHIEQLEKQVASGLKKELAQLPAKYGFSDFASFMQALKEASGKKRGRPANKPTGKKRSKRAKITDATRALVKKLVGAGKTGGQIAKALGISLPSVQNIKKALGLVRQREKIAPKAKKKKVKVLKAAVTKATSKIKKKTAPKKAAAPDAKPAETPASDTVA